MDLREIRFGALAAERDDMLSSYFIESESHIRLRDQNRIRDQNRTVLLGNRGSGKSVFQVGCNDLPHTPLTLGGQHATYYNVVQAVRSPSPIAKVGDVGEASRVSVIQVLSHTEFLGAIEQYELALQGPPRRLPTIEAKFVDWDTSNLADNTIIDAGYIYLDSTFSYVSAIGAQRTVFVATKISPDLLTRARNESATSLDNKLDTLSNEPPRTNGLVDLQKALRLLPDSRSEITNQQLMSLYPRFFGSLRGRGIIEGTITRIYEDTVDTQLELVSSSPRKPLNLAMRTRDFKRRRLQIGDRVVLTGRIAVSTAELTPGTLIVLIDHDGRYLGIPARNPANGMRKPNALMLQKVTVKKSSVRTD